VGIYSDVRVVVEILFERVPVVRLQQAEQAAIGQLGVQLTQNASEFDLRDVLEQITSERKIHCAIWQKRQIRYAPHAGFDTGLNVLGHLGPDVQGNTPAGFDIVDEVAVSSPELEYAVVFPNPAFEVEVV